MSAALFREPDSDLADDPHQLLELAGTALRCRRERRSLFPPAALRESCWDILLMCLVGQLEDRPLCIKQLRNQLDESHTALLRRVDELEAADMLQRRRDETDGRRTTLHLTPQAIAAMTRFFEGCGNLLFGSRAAG